ncbi:MAG: type II toxin-antitoxin system VapC family toxin [Isosphaerales bacterium]
MPRYFFDNAHYQLACTLIGQHGMTGQLRTLDAVQLAVALRLHQIAPIDQLVCADQRLCDIASLEGMAVINPEQP